MARTISAQELLRLSGSGATIKTEQRPTEIEGLVSSLQDMIIVHRQEMELQRNAIGAAVEKLAAVLELVQEDIAAIRNAPKPEKQMEYDFVVERSTMGQLKGIKAKPIKLQ